MAKRGQAVHVSTTRRKYKDKVYETHLLRRTFREGGKVKHETLANLSHLPREAIDLLRRSLAGEPMAPASELFEIRRSLPHGHVEAVLGEVKRLGLERMLGARRSRERDLVVAMIVQRVLHPCSKLAATREWQDTSLAGELGVADADEDELYEALDWLYTRQPAIEKKLAARHLTNGGLALYDLSSSWVEGKCCPLAAFGESRDDKRGKRQVEYGVLTDGEGRPVAVDVFPGNTADTKTLPVQVTKLRESFGLTEVIIVGDRGMITQTRIEELKDLEGVRWITTLRAPAVRKLVEQGAFQMSLFDERDLAEVEAPDYPGERLVICRNPLLADERTRTRKSLLAATEKKLATVQRSVDNGRLKDKGRIGVAVGKVVDAHKVGKLFRLTIEEGRFTFERDEVRIRAETYLDGLYVMRTNVVAGRMEAPDVVRGYKRLCEVERAFRTLKTVDLHVRPIFLHLENRVRAHFFLCLLAYYVEWHLRRAWRPLLFDEEEREARNATRDPVAPSEPSPAAKAKARTRRTADGFPVHSFRTLLAHLATQCKNLVHLKSTSVEYFQLTSPTPLQTRAYQLLQRP